MSTKPDTPPRHGGSTSNAARTAEHTDQNSSASQPLQNARACYERTQNTVYRGLATTAAAHRPEAHKHAPTARTSGPRSYEADRIPAGPQTHKSGHLNGLGVVEVIK
eukprot:CAMPEP_0183486456 /NCGR_PEP_ID=MMETSP0370-20130417/179946_1 /TAXON_ID=268820 /ORGANISM="Peridinium aciculiferum, Strain PAER-2" /LENGTH=106 /DNA_ID=CAMNT_0025679775 /DNA_START=185 /DNA_END=504 /DNA_ORIENTATION=+